MFLFKTPRAFAAAAALFALLGAIAAAARAEETARPALRRVETKHVCMINNQDMGRDQIPVEIDKKTYYGCCEGCKKALAEKPETRVALDPMTGKTVDKASAVIAAKADGSVLYFESEQTFEEFLKKQ
jgi:YHS domain-containing protein